MRSLKSRSKQDNVLPMVKPTKYPLKLDIGAGDFPRDPDYTTVDLYNASADIKAPAWEIPLEDNSVEEIWSSHTLEHIPCVKIHPTLKEWFRLLKQEGKAIIQVPNFDYIAKYWLYGEDRSWAEKMVYGLQTHDGEFHKTAWRHDILKNDLEQVGFVVERVEIRWTHNQETLQAVCVKPIAK